MLRLSNLAIPLESDDTSLKLAVSRKLHIPPDRIRSARIVRKSIDARDKQDVHLVVSVDLEIVNESAVLQKQKKSGLMISQPYQPPDLPVSHLTSRPIVVGAGPAGLFASLILSRAGACPILLERGNPVEQREHDIAAMMESGILNPESNVQFGEGGAGTFSDGKLTTGIKSPWQRFVLETFVAFGAPEDILIDQKPHIGTDILRVVIRNMRMHLLSLGCEIRFQTRVSRLILHGETIAGVHVVNESGEEDLLSSYVMLCIGHSSRDTLESLYAQHVHMERKPFAMGVRIEHLQEKINLAQYGSFATSPYLGAAPYKLHTPTPDGCGVYSFCMCPGGYVMPASSEAGRLCVNGMSLHARDGRNANSALLVGLPVSCFPSEHPLSGMYWQQEVEEKAYRLGGGGFLAGAQRVEDFLLHRPSTRFGDVVPSYLPGVVPADLHAVLPECISENLSYAIPRLDLQLHGFADPDAVLTGMEARSSSPVRLVRSDDGQSVSTHGLFPCGEGAGYAGGIVSAAVDGINQALRVLKAGSTST